MKIWGIHKKHPGLSWWENFMGGHFSIGNLTVFGENAMHWAIEWRSKKYGIIVFAPPIKTFGQYWGWHLYFSPNATPWACTYYIGSNKAEKIRAKIRRWQLGHNFDTDKNWTILQTINHKFEWINVTRYDIDRFAPTKEKGDYIPEGDCIILAH